MVAITLRKACISHLDILFIRITPFIIIVANILHFRITTSGSTLSNSGINHNVACKCETGVREGTRTCAVKTVKMPWPRFLFAEVGAGGEST